MQSLLPYNPLVPPPPPPPSLSLSVSVSSLTHMPPPPPHPHAHRDGERERERLEQYLFCSSQKYKGKTNQSFPHAESIYGVEICMTLWVLDFSYSHVQLCWWQPASWKMSFLHQEYYTDFSVFISMLARKQFFAVGCFCLGNCLTWSVGKLLHLYLHRHCMHCNLKTK